MAKIVAHKDLNIVKCDGCGKLVQYSQEDKKGGHEFSAFGTIRWEYIICPNCGHEIQF